MRINYFDSKIEKNMDPNNITNSPFVNGKNADRRAKMINITETESMSSESTGSLSSSKKCAPVFKQNKVSTKTSDKRHFILQYKSYQMCICCYQFKTKASPTSDSVINQQVDVSSSNKGVEAEPAKPETAEEQLQLQEATNTSRKK